MYKNSNQNMKRKQAKQRAADYKAARNEPGADKGRLKRQFHKDKRARKRDEKAEHQLNLQAYERRHQKKKYDRAKADGTFKEGDHQDYINKTGAFDKKRTDAYKKYQSRRQQYGRKPGSLSAMTGFKERGRRAGRN